MRKLILAIAMIFALGITGLAVTSASASESKTVAISVQGQTSYPVHCSISYYIGSDGGMVQDNSMSANMELQVPNDATNGDAWCITQNGMSQDMPVDLSLENPSITVTIKN